MKKSVQRKESKIGGIMQKRRERLGRRRKITLPQREDLFKMTDEATWRIVRWPPISYVFCGDKYLGSGFDDEMAKKASREYIEDLLK